MFTLVTENNRFFRVRRGLCKSEIEDAFLCPVSGEAFCGRIIERGERCIIYRAKPCETYFSIAKKFGVGEEELKKLNSFKAVYPTARVFVPLPPASNH